MKDTRDLVFAVEKAIADHDESSRNNGLDHLRMSFLTGLAHELRTPLTAIKLALDNLFAPQAPGHLEPRAKLIAIGQRNIDRIIQLVEGQLDLLQITLGDVSVSRRCVDLRDVLERAAADSQFVEIDGSRVFMFTDPDRLGAAVKYVLQRGALNRNEPVRVRYATDGDGYGVDIEFSNTRLGGFWDCEAGGGLACGTERSAAGYPDECFETRALHRIVASLSGEFTFESGRTGDLTRLRFPLQPRYDEREDFSIPVGGLRKAANLSGKTVSLVECAVDRGGDASVLFSPGEKELFSRARSVLSDGDVLVRGPSEGRYCLALVDRRTEELDQLTDFLSQCARVEIVTAPPCARDLETVS
jgi:hypothetical protein